MKKLPRVEVEWDDATSSSAWQHYSRAKDSTPLRCISRGFLVSKDRANIRVALSFCPEGVTVSDVVIIPRQWVRKIRISK